MLYDILDGTTSGDGSSVGKCWEDDSNGINNRKCLSTGECNACKIINNAHEGCDIHSTTPVCDADSTTAEIDDSAVSKLATCSACKNSGENNVLKKYYLLRTTELQLCKTYVQILCYTIF